MVVDPGTFRPAPENPDAPRVEVLDLELPPAWRPVTLACSAAGRLAVAHWAADGELRLQIFDAAGQARGSVVLEGAEHAHALAWIDEATVALRVADLAEALAYALPGEPNDGDTLAPLGRRYPSADAAPGPFVAALAWPPHLPLSQPPDAALSGPEATLRFSRELVPLAWRAYRGSGSAVGRVIDSGQLGLEWHRLVVEAILPAGCGLLVEVAAADDGAAPGDWWPHWFGDAEAAPPLPARTPRGIWQREGSELPHRAGLLDCPPQPGRVGLFGVLLQRTGQRLRSLRGRFLHLRVQLFGNGRSTPEVAALRAWGERFSYVRRYLPELYRDEAVFDRAAAGPATPHDFLERYTQLFESLLTPLEDRVAEAHVLSDRGVHRRNGWTGWPAGPATLSAARRPGPTRLAAAGAGTRRLRGTLGGSTGWTPPAASAGPHRSSRTACSARWPRCWYRPEPEDDPLLPGWWSGNSFVGDTLVSATACAGAPNSWHCSATRWRPRPSAPPSPASTSAPRTAPPCWCTKGWTRSCAAASPASPRNWRRRMCC